MPFLEERISVDIRYDARYHDEFNVEHTETSSGGEYPRLIHPFPRRQFTIAYQLEREEMFAEVMNLYYRAYGTFAGFRAKCVDDYSTNNNTQTPTHLDQTLVQLTSTTYQFVKEYGTDKTGIPVIGRPKRTLYKLVSGTIAIGVGAVLVTTGYTVDVNTGVVTFSSAPGGVVTGGCYFDIPVRFVNPVPVTINHKTSRYLDSVELIELLNPLTY
jgi:uncharacterized protein (TIGR02217 family)